MDTIAVEKNVPIPEVLPPPQYPFATLEIGDSFVRPVTDTRLVRAHALKFKKQNPGWNCMTKTTPEGLRVWRTA